MLTLAAVWPWQITQLFCFLMYKTVIITLYTIYPIWLS